MHLLPLMICLIGALTLTGCSSAEKEELEGAEFENLVLAEEEETEWTSGQAGDLHHVAGDLVPEPEEAIHQIPEGPGPNATIY